MLTHVSTGYPGFESDEFKEAKICNGGLMVDVARTIVALVKVCDSAHHHGIAVARPTPLMANSRLQSLSICFITFPLAVFGSSSGCPSSPTNHTHAGAFWRIREKHK